MQNRNKVGQYTNKKRGVISKLAKVIYIAITLVVIIFMITYKKPSKVPSTSPVGSATFVQEATEDPRIEEYLRSEEAKLQAKLSIYEKDRTDAIQLNKDNVTQIEADYQNALKAEKDRHAKELFKINSNLDEVRKAQLGKTEVKGN